MSKENLKEQSLKKNDFKLERIQRICSIADFVSFVIFALNIHLLTLVIKLLC